MNFVSVSVFQGLPLVLASLPEIIIIFYFMFLATKIISLTT